MPASDASSGPSRASLRAEQVAVRYAKRPVVQDVTVSCEAQSVVGILGPNGAGKTSLLKALAGLVPFEGSVSYGGRKIHTLSPLERARTITYVPQRSLLESGLSVQEVVAQGRYCHREGWGGSASAQDHAAIAKAMTSVDAEALATRSFQKLSGGEQRRILLARALATESKVILLDEPTASLDIAHALAFFQTLRQLAQEGRTIVCVLHDLADAMTYCDELLLLKQGRTQAFGPPAQVVQPAQVREVYGVEMVEGGAFSYQLPKESP